MWMVSFSFLTAIFSYPVAAVGQNGKLKNIFPAKARYFTLVHTGNLATYFIPFPSTSWKVETNGWRDWRVSHFLIHCFSESLELSYKMCRLRKIGKDLFKDFSVCSLMFQDASGMTVHMSLFLCGALRIQKQRKVNSFCVNERAAVRGPKTSVSFSSWAAELGNSLKMYSPKISIRTFPNI